MAKIPELRISITDMPITLANMRTELANALREVAAAEATLYVRTRLERVAAAFEAGQRVEGDRG